MSEPFTSDIIRICVRCGSGPDLWWVGGNPWPGLPISINGQAGAGQQMTFRCCPDDGPVALWIAAVELHLPRNDLDPAFTVIVNVQERDVEHFAERHGFTWGG